MPKKKKNSPSQGIVLGNVTIEDYADSITKGCNISKKTVPSTILKIVADMDFNDCSTEVIDEENVIPVAKKNRKKNLDLVPVLSGQYQYPTDVWFLISQYIQPEDIQNFACVCRQTAQVVSSASFWFSMYKRYEFYSSEIPPELMCWNMGSHIGLKPSVIRSLFYMYQPFVERIAKARPLDANFDKIIKCVCISQWHLLADNQCKYYYQFENKDQPSAFSSSDVHINSEANRCLLEITTQGTCNPSIGIGRYLYHASISLTSTLCEHRLKLYFTTREMINTVINTMKKSKAARFSADVIMEPVVDVKVYNWWHPNYQKSLLSLGYQNSDSDSL